MSALANIGSIIRVGASEVHGYYPGPLAFAHFQNVEPFCFRVQDWLMDGHVFYGVYGPVLGTYARFKGMICSAIPRFDAVNWLERTQCVANFKIGPSAVHRIHDYEYRHPDGTRMAGYPRFSLISTLEVVSESESLNFKPPSRFEKPISWGDYHILFRTDE